MERLWLKAACSERNITKASAPMRRNGPIFTLLYSARTRPNAIHVQSLAEAEEFVRRQRGLEVAIFLENVVPTLFIERGTGALVPIVEFWRASNFDRASYRVPQGSFFVPPAVVKMRTNNVRLRMRTAPDSTGKQVTIAAITRTGSTSAWSVRPRVVASIARSWTRGCPRRPQRASSLRCLMTSSLEEACLPTRKGAEHAIRADLSPHASAPAGAH